MVTIVNAFTAQLFEQVGRGILDGVVKVITGQKRDQAKARNPQCVKLSKDHESVTRMVEFWCELRNNKLKQLGVDDRQIQSIVKCDARFLTVLAFSIATQTEEQPDFDAWLFFNENIQATDYFELQQCPRGSKIAKATFIVQASC